jgi:N-acetylneuraminic acid mutarotase
MKKTILLMLVLALYLASICLAAENTWTTKAGMPTARSYLSASVVDGKIYVIGGLSNQTISIPTVEVYDPVSNTWERKADMPTARLGLSTSVVDGRIYAIGGLPGAGVVGAACSKVEEYDPVTDTWVEKADMPTARLTLATEVVDGRIYAIGGHLAEPAPESGAAGLSTVEEYDPVNDTWTRKADMPTRRTGLSASVVDGKIYAIGGVTGSPWAGLHTVEVYDPATDTWMRKADMPTGRYNFSISVVNGKIYAIGGSGTNPWPGLTAVEMYDPATNTWVRKADMPTGKLASATGTVNGKIYVIGGCAFLRPFQPVFSTVEEYDTGLGVPSPDFNGDGIVDSMDMCILVEHWQSVYPPCDIAPPPFGDGIVDVQDLIALAEHLFEEIFPPELVAYWKLDETEGDIAENSTSDNHGILSGDPTWLPDSGKIAGTLEFDGIDDYITADFVLNPVLGPFGVFAWIKGGAPGQVIIAQTDGIGTGSVWLGADASDGKLMTGLAPVQVGRYVPPPLISESIITDDQWHHVGFVWDGAYRSLYVDGTEVAKDTAVQNPLKYADGGMYIGAGKNLEAGTFFSGLIDDVRVYNKALSADEIAAPGR